MDIKPFENRLKKRAKHLRKKAKSWQTNAYRVYDRDLPEVPFVIDIFNDLVHLQEFKTSKADDRTREIIVDCVKDILNLKEEDIAFTLRQRGDGATRYRQRNDEVKETIMNEGPYQFEIIAGKYVDVGFFPDHRRLRKHVGKIVDASMSVLNLFAYTGAFSVFAAGSGARVTTVDMSNTYIDWAIRNFELNNIPPSKHRFERLDTFKFLKQEFADGVLYDLIILDPPTFSKSKKMDGDFDVLRDHVAMIEQTMRLLKPGGTLYFSTNHRRFTFNHDELEGIEISDKTHSEDYPRNTHRSWELKK